MLYNDNKYIIINTELWKIICENGRENEKPIKYEISTLNIKLFFEGEKHLIISYYQKSKNIIDRFSCYNYDFNNLGELKKICEDINKYYRF